MFHFDYIYTPCDQYFNISGARVCHSCSAIFQISLCVGWIYRVTCSSVFTAKIQGVCLDVVVKPSINDCKEQCDLG